MKSSKIILMRTITHFIWRKNGSVVRQIPDFTGYKSENQIGIQLAAYKREFTNPVLPQKENRHLLQEKTDQQCFLEAEITFTGRNPVLNQDFLSQLKCSLCILL